MKKVIKKVINKTGYSVNKKTDNSRYQKIQHTYKDFTMIFPETYIENLRLVDQFVHKIEGDIVECGVWRGGMSAGIATLLGNKRKYYLFDSFEGLPPAKEIDGENAIAWQQNTSGEDYFDNCKAEMAFADKAMHKTHCPYVLTKGWFSESLPGFQFEKPIALLRLDGDWYESTMDCLVNLYPKVTEGGLIIIDDYYTWDGCAKAVHDYLSSIKSASRIYMTGGGLCYLIKKTIR